MKKTITLNESELISLIEKIIKESNGIVIDGKTIKTYTQNGDKSYNVVFDDGTKKIISVSNDVWDDINTLHRNSLSEETGTSSSGSFSTALDQPIRRKIRTGLTKEEFIKLKEYMEMDESLSEGKKKTGTKLCTRGKAAAKSKFKVYPSAYSNSFAVQVCKGRFKGLDGQKKCSGSYC
jgi:hypothetical protein